MRSSQNENFARLEGVLTGSFLGLQKTLSELLLPLNNSLKRACSESDDVASTFQSAAGPSSAKKASKAIAKGCTKTYSSAIAIGNTKNANRTNVNTASKRSATHTATRHEDPPESDHEDLDYDENMSDVEGENEYNNPNNDSISIPEQDSLDADVQALLQDNADEKGGDADALLSQMQEDLLFEADTADAVNDKLAEIILGLWGQKLAPEKIKARLNKFLKPKNCDLFVPKCNKDIWSEKIDTSARQFDLTMQKVQNMILHSTFGVISISDKALQAKSQETSEIASMSIDLAAILTNVMHEISQIRRDNMKPKLGVLGKLANDVAPNAPLLFGSEDDLNKRITKVMAASTAIAKSSKGRYFAKNFKTPPYHSRYGMRGQRGGRARGRPFQRPSRRYNGKGQN